MDLIKKNKIILRKYSYDPDVPIKLDFYPFQRAGINFGYKSLKRRGAFILADEMGLGKTLQAIGIALKLKKINRVLVICPKNAKGEWKRILQAYTNVSYSIIYNKDCLESRTKFTIINYDRLKEIIKRHFKYHLIIVDEFHNIKNKDTIRAKMVNRLNCQYKIFLSGTPILNRLEELWVVLNMIDPEQFSNYIEYVGRYSKKKKIRIRMRYGRRFYYKFITKFYGGKNIDELRKLISPYFLRRRKREVLKSLPDKIEQYIYVDLTLQQRRLYDQIVKKLKMKIDKKKITIKSAMAQFTRTRQLCGTTAAFDLRDKSSTLDALEELVKDYLYGEHKFFIIAPFKATVRCAYERLKKLKINCVYVDGDTSERDAEKFKKRFQTNSRCKAYIGTIDKNKEALTLTAADYVIFLGKSLVPKINEQVADRLHRIGQKKVVNVINIINRDTVEEKIEETILAPKEKLFDDMFDRTGNLTIRLNHIRKLI